MDNASIKSEILTLYKEGMKTKDIHEKLNTNGASISLEALKKRINRMVKNDNELKEEHKKNNRKLILNKIKELYSKGYTSMQIGEQIELDASTVRNYISVYCQDLKDIHYNNSKLDLLEKIKHSYKSGMTTSEIAEDLGVSSSKIKKFTCSFSEDIKKEHEINYKKRIDIRRECKRIFTKSDNKTMNTEQLVKLNRQSYFTTKNGNLEFDTSRGALPIDMPKVFTFRG
ncbi:hypothetical protein [Clostridium butyricum]|uniref:hypothetical protein n=1 Tax=Clostridium butyricum TaxID=1492 RepID=UPI0022E8FFB7|nr:hypothetical protein [Clostridium butyricum]MDU3597544.1 hypothetical protein [Clostridium butyricum]